MEDPLHNTYWRAGCLETCTSGAGGACWKSAYENKSLAGLLPYWKGVGATCYGRRNFAQQRKGGNDPCSPPQSGMNERQKASSSIALYRRAMNRWGVAIHDAVYGEIAAPERYLVRRAANRQDERLDEEIQGCVQTKQKSTYGKTAPAS